MALRLVQLAFLVYVALGAQLSIKNPKVEVVSSGKSQKETLSLEQPLSTPLELGNSDVLKLSFQVILDPEDEGVQPHQSFLRLIDPETDEEGILPLRVSSSGKVKYELNMAKPPLTLPPTTSSPLQVVLILGSYEHTGAIWHLFDLVLPASQPPPQAPDEYLYHPQPEIHHTFRSDQKHAPQFISGVFTVAVAAPWLVLVGMLSQIEHPLPNLMSSTVMPFVALLGCFEYLLFKYWVSLKLGDVLLYGSILGLPTLAAGKRALTALSHQRLGTKA